MKNRKNNRKFFSNPKQLGILPYFCEITQRHRITFSKKFAKKLIADKMTGCIT